MDRMHGRMQGMMGRMQGHMQERMQGMMGFMQGSDGEAGTQCPRFLDENGNGVCDRMESRDQREEDNSHNHD